MPSPTPNILYYQVKGSTESELAKEIQTKGPNGFAGYTNWYIRWGWPGFGHEECDLSGAWITTKASVTLPEWDPPVGVPSDLIKNWTEFSQALYKHEMGHVGNITDALPLIEDAIHSADCVTADSAANIVLANCGVGTFSTTIRPITAAPRGQCSPEPGCFSVML